MAVAPNIGLLLLARGGFPLVFSRTVLAAAISVLFAVAMREPGRRPRGSTGADAPLMGAGTGEDVRTGKAWHDGLINVPALFPSAVVFLLTVTYGSVVTYVPLLGDERGASWAVGLFFTVYAVTVLLSRPLAGRLSDLRGRGAVIVPGLILGAVSMFVLAFAGDALWFAVSAVAYGLAIGSAQPALMALAVDRAGPSGRGSAMGTFTAAFDLGIGVATFSFGFLARAHGLSAVYVASGISALAGLLVFLRGSRDVQAWRRPAAREAGSE